jgi:hypothetical protein
VGSHGRYPSAELNDATADAKAIELHQGHATKLCGETYDPDTNRPTEAVVRISPNLADYKRKLSRSGAASGRAAAAATYRNSPPPGAANGPARRAHRATAVPHHDDGASALVIAGEFTGIWRCCCVRPSSPGMFRRPWSRKSVRTFNRGVPALRVAAGQPLHPLLRPRRLGGRRCRAAGLSRHVGSPAQEPENDSQPPGTRLFRKTWPDGTERRRAKPEPEPEPTPEPKPAPKPEAKPTPQAEAKPKAKEPPQEEEEEKEEPVPAEISPSNATA